MSDLSDVCVWMNAKIRELRSKLPKPLRRLSQHFMSSCRIGYAFCKALLNLKPNCVFELGAGVGFLTRFISVCSPQVVAVEIDYRLASILRENLLDLPNVHLLLGDGLQFLRSDCLRADVLVSNSPYSVTGPLLSSYVKSGLKVALLTLQEEVAERVRARPGSRGYGRISVLVQVFNDVYVMNRFPPNYFIPRPKVASRLVLLRRKRVWRKEYELLEELTKCVFSQRRRRASKVMRYCLMKMGYAEPIISKVIKDVLREDLRVYELEPDTYFKLIKSLTNS